MTLTKRGLQRGGEETGRESTSDGAPTRETSADIQVGSRASPPPARTLRSQAATHAFHVPMIPFLVGGVRPAASSLLLLPPRPRRAAPHRQRVRRLRVPVFRHSPKASCLSPTPHFSDERSASRLSSERRGRNVEPSYQSSCCCCVSLAEALRQSSPTPRPRLPLSSAGWAKR